MLMPDRDEASPHRVTAAREELDRRGYEVLTFHATGTGGRAMERLIEDGFIAGVLDVSTTELADELVGWVMRRASRIPHGGLYDVDLTEDRHGRQGMVRRMCAAGFVAAAGALALMAGGAWGTVASTKVRSVKAYTVDGKPSLDVTVAYPDAGSRTVSPNATNRGTVRVIVKDDAGRVLALRKGSVDLPIDVPHGSKVLHTYRFAMPAGVADLDRVRVKVVAGGHLDPDGPGPQHPVDDIVSKQVDPDINSLSAPPRGY
jgi:hypothetical protein